MPEVSSRIRQVGSWVTIIAFVIVGGWIASWGFYSLTIQKQLELAKVEAATALSRYESAKIQLQSQSERIAQDERENARKHEASLADRNQTKQTVEENRKVIDGMRRDLDALRAQVNSLAPANHVHK